MVGKRSPPPRPKNGGQEETDHLSGAYIRSLVKQLSTSGTQKTTSDEEQREKQGNIIRAHNNNITHSNKKKVRRRVQARKPYQERLLNMAEARREIVAALRLHRATMKRAGDREPPRPEIESGPVPSNRADDFACSPPGFYTRPVSPLAAPPLFGQENLDLALPSQTLGLNLNLRDFHDLGTSFFQFNSNNSSVLYSSSSPSTSTSSAPSAAAGEDIQYVAGDPPTAAAEIRDRHRIGISDWRAEFMESVEIGPDEELQSEDFVFDEVVEFPEWMNENESYLQAANDLCGGDYFQDPSSLPCMDIEEIEGMDGDWLA